MSGNAQGLLQPQIFESLQRKIDEETEVRDSIREIVQALEKQGQDRSTQAILSRAHSSSTNELPAVVSSAQESINKEVESIAKLSEAASKYPYYKYNGMWTRHVQDASFSILLCGYLGGFSNAGPGSQDGRLLTIEEVGQVMNVRAVELYMRIGSNARLARNSVTQGDYSRPVQIAKFIKHVHAGFQILNLKNDSLRKRSDGIKYRVKEVEDVVYDLSLRGLTPKE
ncbi:Translin [Aureobasidium sp. EXF-3400]|nr:Translin [Aureobasidium sp. EXF-12344]KAI4780865.1 Translin [Aureobasidium sp. EXF-3400]